MKNHSRKENILTLEKVLKYQKRLNEAKQDTRHINGKYIEAVIQLHNIERRLKIEEERTGFYYDCIEHLYFSIIQAQSLSNEEKEAILAKYKDFKQRVYQAFLDKKNTLTDTGVYINLKYQERRISG